MANKLNYQQSREIRKTKFSDLFLDTLARKETGVLSSVGKAISLKSQARIKGIKEKFDPLNIVKFLTFGSKLGPALYGKMAGRNQKDIDYFTGRSRHITGGRNTADKIKGTGGDGDNQGINEQLAKIFTFLKSSREDDVKLKQQAKNNEEEINMEKDRRHKELVKTLEKLMKQIGGGTATATKAEDRSFLDGILASIQAMKDQIQEIIGSFSGMGLIRGLASWAPRLISFIASPAGLITGIVIAAGFITYEALQKQQKNLDEAAKTGDANKTSLEAARTLDLMNPEAALYNTNLDEDTLELTRQALKDAGTPESIKAAEELKVEIDKKKSTSTATKVTIPEAPAGMEFDADGGLISAPTNIKPKPAPVVPVNKPQPPANMEFDADGGLIKSPAPKKLEPVSSPPSAPVSSLSNTNVELNMPSGTSSNSGERMSKTNNVAMNSRNKGRSGLTPSQISVRNEEPTYNELIAASTRMI